MRSLKKPKLTSNQITLIRFFGDCYTLDQIHLTCLKDKSLCLRVLTVLADESKLTTYSPDMLKWAHKFSVSAVSINTMLVVAIDTRDREVWNFIFISHQQNLEWITLQTVLFKSGWHSRQRGTEFSVFNQPHSSFIFHQPNLGWITLGTILFKSGEVVTSVIFCFKFQFSILNSSIEWNRVSWRLWTFSWNNPT